jgi:hypothetical protein
MSLFDFFRKNHKQDETDLFETENGNPKELTEGDRVPVKIAVPGPDGISSGIDAVYAFLQDDYEARGYDDAFISPDDSYKQDNIRLLRQDLLIQIQRANTYYEGITKELEFHINSRSRAGLVDLVEELKTRKEMVTGYIEKLKPIQADAENGTGLTERIVLSYQRGFMRGLAALTQSRVLNKKL